jgi:uncharacterized phage-associated protein
MDEDYITFDRAKFKAVVHFVCDRCEPSQLGNVKLHKILYFADMMKFAGSGEPLTGADYVKQQFGPVARHLTAALVELSNENKIKIENVDYFGFTKKQYTSLDTHGDLSNSEIDLLTEVIDFVCNRTAREINELSHDKAWHTAKMGQRIPYAAALGLEPVEITEEDLVAATMEARRLRPMIEAETRENPIF